MDEIYIKKIEQLEKGLDKFDTIKEFLKDEKYQNDIIEFLENNFEKIQQDNIKSYALKLVHIKGFDKAVPFLLDAFKKSNDNKSDYKWRIGNALETIGTKNIDYINEMKKIVLDKQHGSSREMMVLALGKSKNETIISTLINLLNDETIYQHVLIALSKFGKPELRQYFERFLNHEKSNIRYNAKKAIEKIDKQSK